MLKQLKKNQPSLQRLMEKYGVEPTAPVPTAPGKLEEWSAPTELSEQLASKFVEIGQPGTPFSNGQLVVEPNWQMRPYLARGSYGSYGVFDELMREPAVYSSVNTLTGLIKTGKVACVLSEDAEALDPEGSAAALEEGKRILAGLRNIEGGLEGYFQQACTAILKGFAVFEVVYGVDRDDNIYPTKLAFREQSTVYRWVLDKPARELMCAEFRTGTDTFSHYVIPKYGQGGYYKLLIANIGAAGLNFEGISPARPVRLLVDYKKLLYAIRAASAESYGCPTVIIGAHPALYSAQGVRPNLSAQKDFYEAWRYAQALDTPVIEEPFGSEARVLAPGGQMPDFNAVIDQINTEINQAFNTQAQQLGHAGGGSYALAVVQENDQLGAAAAYAMEMLKPVNDLMRDLLRRRGHTTPFLPRAVWTPQMVEDTSRWFDDLVKYESVKAGMSPQDRAIARGKLGLPPEEQDA